MGSTMDIKPFADSAKALGAVGFFSSWATGELEQANGVAVTTDGGASWNVYDLGNSTDMHDYPARYGAFPTEDTWYVSTGTWPTDDASKIR